MFSFSRVLCLILSLLIVLPALAKPSSVIRFYSEISAPFYWLDDEGRPQGVNYDLANALIEQSKLNATIEHLPWARALQQAVNQPNVVLMSVLRTKEREPQFQWLGSIDKAEASFIKLTKRTDIQLNNLEQVKLYRVGTIRGYGAANFLISQGFEDFDNLTLVANTDQLWTMLYKGRIDLVLSNPTTSQYEAESHGLDPSKIQPTYNVSELSLSLAVATGHQTNNKVVEQLSSGLEALKANGTYDQIMKKWGLM